MSIEAMKQALEALELMYACYAHPEWISHKQQEEKILAQCVATTMTLRQALSEAQLSVNENSHSIEQAEKREWVMLTDAEIEEFDYDVRDLVMDIEKLLMERNS